MTKQSNSEKIEKISKDAQALPSSDSNLLSDEVQALMNKFAAENDTLKEEINLMKKRLHGALQMGTDGLKSEIKHHPMQSIATAFAIGFIASLLVRR